MDSVYLAHHGIKGMKWGVRRWQNSDGTLTEEGKKHYSKGLPGIRRNMQENRIRRLSKRSQSQERWLNSPSTKVKLTKAYAKDDKYAQRYYEYQKAQYKADKAILLKDFKQWRANRAYKRASRANSPKSRQFISKYSEVEYRHALTESNLLRASESYINRYGQEYYDAIRR